MIEGKIVDILLEEFLKRVAQLFVDELIEYSKYLIQVQDRYNLKAIQVSGYSILRLDEVSIDVKNKIYEYQHNMKCLIAASAEQIEERQYSNNKINQGKIDLTGKENERTMQIIENKRNLNLSFQTLQAILKLFIETNERVKLNIKSATNPNDEYIERLKNAVLVYELLDFTYNYINEFRLFGKEKLHIIREDINKDINEAEAEDVKLKNKILGEDAKEISTKKVERINKRIVNRHQIREYTLSKWKEFESKISETENQITTIKKILKELDIYRDDAKNHIGSLYLLPLVDLIEQNLDIVEELSGIDWNLLEDFSLADLIRMTGSHDNQTLNLDD